MLNQPPELNNTEYEVPFKKSDADVDDVPIDQMVLETADSEEEVLNEYTPDNDRDVESDTDESQDENDGDDKAPAETEADGDASDTDAVDEKKTAKPQNYTMDEEVFGDSGDYIEYTQGHLPSHTTEETLGPIATALNMELREDQRTKNWAFTLSRGHNKNTINGALSSALYNGDWRQSVPSDRGNLSGHIPATNTVSNTKLYGKEAILRLLAHVGGASSYEIPLWHTGIWVSLDPITDSDILDLFRILNEDKIQLGRYTNGAIFSNTSAFTTKRVVDFVISKIGETTYRTDPNVSMDLGKVISINDIPLLLLALCNSMYPNGFKHNRSCVYNPKSCNDTYSGIVDFDKILWTDITALSQAQVRMMSTGQDGQADDRILAKWTSELDRPDSRTVDIETLSGTSLRFIFKVPRYNEYVDSGYTWLNGISDAIKDSIEIEDLEDRNKFIDDNARATILRQYGHYIESISFGDGNLITENVDIEEALDALSSDSNIRKHLIEGITKFIDDTTMSLVGIPTYECLKCGGGQADDGRGIYKHILPLDMIELFFSILIDRVQRIKTTTI